MVDRRKEQRSVEERIEHILDQSYLLPAEMRELLKRQFTEALRDQREMSVEAIGKTFRYHGSKSGFDDPLRDAGIQAVLAAKLEDEQ